MAFTETPKVEAQEKPESRTNTLLQELGGVAIELREVLSPILAEEESNPERTGEKTVLNSKLAEILGSLESLLGRIEL